MQLLTFTTAAGLLLTSALAAPLEAAASSLSWSVTDYSFTRDDNRHYHYSFNVQGDGKVDETPPFTATCSGTQQPGYQECETYIWQPTMPGTFKISANVNVVANPNDPSKKVPRVFIKTHWVNEGQCSYTDIGRYDAPAVLDSFYFSPVSHVKGEGCVS
ncbi:uncharacterized protein LTR77_003268 [Saxophila tyrrhenica]|uniref:AA1-like domain-containing protein n=1 Tax=Saxophila tyrrhenica TaxID=1690608 RepID=A0AAV9PHV3_9PEZI|nr:hypothetical protein LTR77_003268 [Saxophila tyrrhenica]